MCPYALLLMSLCDVMCVFTQMLPLVELVFEMPALRPTRGSPRWVKFMRENLHHATFRDMSEFPSVFRAAYKMHKRSFNNNGRPKLVNTDMLIWNSYAGPKRKNKAMLSPRTKSAHSYFGFLRGVGKRMSLCIYACVLTHI